MDQTRVDEFIAVASEVAGSVSGACLGLVVAGPVGVVGGAALGPAATRIIRRTCVGVYESITGRGAARATGAAAFALAEIQRSLDSGQPLRGDNFFDDQTARSPADEVLEGVMLKCRDEHEEKKAKFYGHLFASAATNERYNVGFLNHSLEVLDRLTYQQLCLLRIFRDGETRALRSEDYSAIEETLGDETVNVLAQVHELHQRFLLHCVYTMAPEVDEPNSRMFIMDPYQVVPARMQLTRFGADLVELLKLEQLPVDDVGAVEALLR